MSRVGVVLPAAGSGERLGSAVPKQYIQILGKPLFMYAVEQLISFSWVKTVVLAADDVATMRHFLSSLDDPSKVVVTLGGTSRHESISRALKVLPDECEIAIVHDAARPIVSEQVWKGLVLEAAEHGAAGLTRPLVSTVVQPDLNGFLHATLVRKNFLNSETPQAFSAAILKAAYSKMSDEERINGTECLDLVHRHCNVRAKLVPGPSDLWKVTIPRDLHVCEGTLSALDCDLEIVNLDCEGGEEVSQAAKALSAGLFWKTKSEPTFREDLINTCSSRQIIFLPLEMLNSALKSYQRQSGITVFILRQASRGEIATIFNTSDALKENKCAVIFAPNLGQTVCLTQLVASIIKYPNAFYGQVLKC
ncbi:Hypothetical predicted protein [Cloeon dipterum]|uniref:2-C-methyl-D-erythritol 4-phosphate cytidylyltransferase n=1 Tax=Cloeon dipterum TaxID=197152 RepID=A0A8S1CDZ9_9INSE|nr:Hypothetical predicted protein [Cloeon dipterum]